MNVNLAAHSHRLCKERVEKYRRKVTGFLKRKAEDGVSLRDPDAAAKVTYESCCCSTSKRGEDKVLVLIANAYFQKYYRSIDYKLSRLKNAFNIAIRISDRDKKNHILEKIVLQEIQSINPKERLLKRDWCFYMQVISFIDDNDHKNFLLKLLADRISLLHLANRASRFVCEKIIFKIIGFVQGEWDKFDCFAHAMEFDPAKKQQAINFINQSEKNDQNIKTLRNILMPFYFSNS